MTPYLEARLSLILLMTEYHRFDDQIQARDSWNLSA